MNKALAAFVRDRLWVLRRKADKQALHVSYTPEGLIWATAKNGKSLFFRNARVVAGKIVGDLTVSDQVEVEPFDPIEHSKVPLQRAELRSLDRALRMLY